MTSHFTSRFLRQRQRRKLWRPYLTTASTTLLALLGFGLAWAESVNTPPSVESEVDLLEDVPTLGRLFYTRAQRQRLDQVTFGETLALDSIPPEEASMSLPSKQPSPTPTRGFILREGRMIHHW